jgi:hypothetical protein
MPDDARPVALEPDSRPEAPEIDDRSFADHPSAGDARASKARRRRILRWVLFLLLPIVLIGAGYWYITGATSMYTEDAYVDADQVGLSTMCLGWSKKSTSRRTSTSRPAKSCFASTPSRSNTN